MDLNPAVKRGKPKYMKAAIGPAFGAAAPSRVIKKTRGPVMALSARE